MDGPLVALVNFNTNEYDEMCIPSVEQREISTNATHFLKGVVLQWKYKFSAQMRLKLLRRGMARHENFGWKFRPKEWWGHN